MAIYELDGQAPELPADGDCFVADTATVAGKIRMHKGSSIWFGAVLRGDNEWIELGENSNIQDNCTCHTDPGFPLTIGKNCTIGHNVILHGCTIEDGALIGMGAIVMNGARIRRGCVVGAGAVGPPLAPDAKVGGPAVGGIDPGRAPPAGDLAAVRQRPKHPLRRHHDVDRCQDRAFRYVGDGSCGRCRHLSSRYALSRLRLSCHRPR